LSASIAKDTVKLTSAKMITVVVSMISAMLLSRFRTLEEYGTYSQILLVVNLITTILMLGLPNSINFFLARAETSEEREKFLSVFYTLSTCLSFITGLVLVCSTPIIVDYFENPIIKDFIYILAVYPWAKIVISSIDHILVVYKKTTRLMLFRIANSICLLLIILLVEVLNWSFAEYMLLFIVVEVSFTFSVYLIVRNIAGSIKFYIERELIIKILKFSLPLGLASVVGTISVELDKLIIGGFYNVEQLAIYTNASREMPVSIIASSLTAILMPQLVRLLKDNENETAVRLWGDATGLSYMFICFFAATLFVFAPEVISFLYSDKYLPGVTVFRIYCLVLLLRCTYFGMVLNSLGKTKFIFYSSLVSLGLNVVLSFILYYILGFIGPAVATFISMIIIAISQLIASTKTLSVSFKKIFPWRTIGIISVINIFYVIVFMILKEAISIQVFTGETIKAILLGMLWGILYIFTIKNFFMKKWNILNQ
jgi:O-antigen/teichoic acid export membrane protein